ncbi:thiol-disulfide oxidoreductase DCC family protein [Aurantiacibacter poecillastricola]|uniref:thiol-disulfide oxidoreductase DCC family protein n=1 Tax=Aurantiacibacter poecillastricola TaxID=3064385 RepID=UPI00273FEB73|nr:thiol-disulfide oxidoreductase DCC family protein [Aurantiacibacter sp. 219JJ12-13]MDP5261828.1 thiol-disulfide oxidoreductase DCC family protein [Aurantiacibacter sp. 219JJ12-13]
MNVPPCAIVLFDAECVLCSANAQFILKHDRKRHFRLASMQGETGMALYRKHGMDPSDPDTILLIEGDRVLRNSDAVLGIYHRLGWPWRITDVARLVPRALRDAVYLWVARNRYRLFGKRETCWLPNLEYRDRLL